MSLRSLVPVLVLAACTSAAPVDDTTDDTDVGQTDETDDTTEETDEETEETDDSTDETDPDEDGIATSWTGTWNFTFTYYERDWSHQGQGEKWDPVDSSCNAGNVSLTLEEDGRLLVTAPYGVCTSGSQKNWSHMSLDALVEEDGTTVAGSVLFGTTGGPSYGISVGFALPVSGSIGADGDIANGLLTLSASRFNNGVQPHENLQFTATLRPAAE